MKTVLISALSMAAVCFVPATPAFAQATVAGAPAGTAPVTVEGYGFGPGQPGQPGIGSNPPAYYGYGYGPGYGYNGPGYGYYAPGYAGPFGPAGAAAAGLGAVGAGVVGAAGTVTAGAVGAPLVVPAYVSQPIATCSVYHDFNGRYMAGFCGP
jgi:hypothetical protein